MVRTISIPAHLLSLLQSKSIREYAETGEDMYLSSIELTLDDEEIDWASLDVIYKDRNQLINPESISPSLTVTIHPQHEVDSFEIIEETGECICEQIPPDVYQIHLEGPDCNMLQLKEPINITTFVGQYTSIETEEESDGL